MNETWRGLLVFVSALLTIWLWAPLSNHPSLTGTGTIVSDTYFGPLHYLTLHTELTEPKYTMQRTLNRKRLAVTTVLSAALWTFVVVKVRSKPLVPPESGADRADAQ